MDSLDRIDFFLKEAEAYVGTHRCNADGSNFSLILYSEVAEKYSELRQKLKRLNLTHLYVARNWSSLINNIRDHDSSRSEKNTFQNLYLNSLNELCRERYFVANLSPENLIQFPSNTLGGSYLEYMCDGRFYEFDKQPLASNSDVEWFFRLIGKTHDFYHLVGEFYHYGWDGGFITYENERSHQRDLIVLAEEVCLYAFIMGQTRLNNVIPIVAEWCNTSLIHCSEWIKNARRSWLLDNDYEAIRKQFLFPSFIEDCEKWMYVSFKTNTLARRFCADEYLRAFYKALKPARKQSVLEEEYRSYIMESFERGVRSKPLVCLKWDQYFDRKLQDVRDFLQVPKRKLFRDGSHYLKVDMGV
ncbi:MAG: hypothetical protein AAGG51_25465 [Cyanobacteria bacterium P01_G01_bin.54]